MLNKISHVKLLSASLLTLTSEPLLAYNPRSFNLPIGLLQVIIIIGFLYFLFRFLQQSLIFTAVGFSSPVIAFLLFPNSDLALVGLVFLVVTAPLGAWIGRILDKKILGISDE